MSQPLKTVLLLALPASGKSEVRRYLRHLDVKECERDFHMGPTVQLDDFPYVHMMRRFDQVLEQRGEPRIFFKSEQDPFQDGRDWGTLIHLINEDHADLVAKRVAKPSSAAALLMDRIDAAGARASLPKRLAKLSDATRRAIQTAGEAEATEMLNEKHANYPASLVGKTLVIEFARGGAEGSTMPLKAPYGYQYSLSQLSPEILQDAVALYVWVTPDESRRKNLARTDPNDPGSILHHGVPEKVMRGEYGCDDMDYLESHSQKPGTLTIEAHGRAFHIPVARFDNRVDRTSFLRDEPAQWAPASVKAIHDGLQGALSRLAQMTGR